MGKRQRRGTDEEVRVRPLLDAAINYLVRNPESTFKKVYFLTYTDQEFEACQRVLRADARLKPLIVNPPVAGTPVAEVPVARNPASLPAASDHGVGAAPREGIATDNRTPAPTRNNRAARSRRISEKR
jgi:hypothetical protein